MRAFVLERPVVAVRQALRVEAHHLAAVADEIHSVALDRNGRRNPALRPVEVRVFLALGHNELPEEFPRFFVEAHQHAAIALMLWIAWFSVVRADIDPPAGDYRRGMCLRAELHNPLDVPAGLGIKRIGQILLVRNHVARPCLAPLGLIRAKGVES